MNPRKIDAIAFDVGRVLMNFDHMLACNKLAQYCALSGHEIRRRIFEGPHVAFELGNSTSADFYRDVIKTLGMTYVPFADFASMWSKIIFENRGVERLIGAIDPSVRVCVVSNTDPLHWREIEKLPVMRQYFAAGEKLIRSYVIGAIKPEVRIWEAVQFLFSCPPDRVLYIDDNAVYVEAAGKFGFKAEQYNCSIPRRDVLRPLQNILAQYGALTA